MMTAKQEGYIYSKCPNEEVIGRKQVYGCEKDDKHN